MSNLFHFLTHLAVNPEQQAAFAQDPTAMMNVIGLSATDQAVLKSGDRAKVAAVFADEFFQPAFCIADPSPDPTPDPDPPPDAYSPQ